MSRYINMYTHRYISLESTFTSINALKLSNHRIIPTDPFMKFYSRECPLPTISLVVNKKILSLLSKIDLIDFMRISLSLIYSMGRVLMNVL